MGTCRWQQPAMPSPPVSFGLGKPAERLPMEPVFCLDGPQHLAGRQNLAELRVILLLQLLNPDVYLIHFPDGLKASPVVAGVCMTIAAHLAEQQTLFSLHLFEQREEHRSLLRREARLGNDELFHFRLKPFGIEMDSVLGGNTEAKRHDGHDNQ